MPDSAHLRVVADADDGGDRIGVAGGNRQGAVAAELGALAIREVDELGPVPFDQRERDLWREERRGAVELFAILAASDAALLRRAALEVASEWANPAAQDLLLDAAQVCR